MSLTHIIGSLISLLIGMVILPLAYTISQHSEDYTLYLKTLTPIISQLHYWYLLLRQVKRKTYFSLRSFTVRVSLRTLGWRIIA